MSGTVRRKVCRRVSCGAWGAPNLGELSSRMRARGAPSMCPVLGIPLIFGTSKIRDTSPTLDRTDNSRGYVPGNVKIISWRANTLKSSGTLDEHQKIVDYMRRELTSET